MLASAACTGDGYTAVFINGMQTDEATAIAEKINLRNLLPEKISGEPLSVVLGYNPPHLNGVADKVQSVFQAFNNPVSQFDLNTILMQVHPQVTTQKILLLGHSQGSFYVNEMYKYLIDHGVPKKSIAVYHIASPASYVAGGGQYVTSTNDKAMNYVRSHEVDSNVSIHTNSYFVAGSTVNSALRANITIPKETGYDTDGWGGHHLDTYMDGAAGRIVEDISAELKNLNASDAATSTEGCFTPPTPDIKYKMQAAAFNALDPIASVVAGTNTYFKNTVTGFLSDIASVFSTPTPVSNNAPQVAAALLPATTPKPQKQKPAAPATIPPVPKSPDSIATKTPVVVEPVTENEPISPILPIAPVVTVPTPPAAPASPWPGYGGGGGESIVTPVEQAQTAATLSLTVNEPADSSLFATTTVTFSGSTDANAIVTVQMGSNSSSTTADSAGGWSLPYVLSEGTDTVSIQAESSGVTSETISRTITIDTAPPEPPVLALSDCDHSLVPGMCVLIGATTTLSWAPSAGAIQYAVVRDDVLGATSTETASIAALNENASTTFAVVAYDAAGNAATSTSIEVGSIVRPVIINEVGWAGDDRSASNQWIELKNTSPYTIDLANFSISRSGGDPIALSGTIAPSNYAVVEPFDIQFTGTNKIIVPFTPLSASGEQLSLLFSGTMTDTTPAVEACGGWCAGAASAALGRNESGFSDLTSPLSMERIDGASDGGMAANWQNTDSYGPWLGSRAGLWGTPGIGNSSGLPDAGVYCGSPSNLVIANHAFNTGSGCMYLSKFITGDTNGALRYGGLYKGDVGNSVPLTGHSFGKAIASDTIDAVPEGTPAGTHFFFVIYEVRYWSDVDVLLFNLFFTDGSQSAPLGNYIIIPFTYEPAN